MANAVPLHGKDTKVSLGANKILGMGNWSLSGIVTDQVDTSEFDNNWKTFKFGMKDGGTVSFSGIYDPDDTTGQEELLESQLENIEIADLRLYVDNTSYYEPCQTTGYFTPNLSTGEDTILSYVNITSVTIDDDMNDVLRISFEGKVSGVMVLV